MSRGHEIILKVGKDNAESFSLEQLKKADAAIEFSTPDSVVKNIHKCFDADVPVVVGTTGWLAQLDAVKENCKRNDKTFFYASNYSIGVNLFFKLNEYAAKLMNAYPEYKISMEEIHHVHKIDSPSGTAISLAIQAIDRLDRKKSWVNRETDNEHELQIISKRIDEVPGTHTVTYSSAVDQISMTHIAHNRKGFALGAVIAAEFIKDKKGIFGMDDLLSN